MRLLAVVSLALVVGGNGLAIKARKPSAPTLRQFLAEGDCLNVGFQPLMNTQFMLLGQMDALRDEGALKKVTGLTGVSTGAFISALYATNDKNATLKFRKSWPGWSKLSKVQKDPELSEGYTTYLKTILPTRFDDLKIPLAITVTLFENELAAKDIDNKHAEPVLVNSGDLQEAIVASSSTMFGKGCPKCNDGFQAKYFRGLWPVTDGFLKDEYGTAGFNVLPKCQRALRVVPMNYEGQCGLPTRSQVDTIPKEMVTLVVTQPMSSVSSVFFEGAKEKGGKFMQNLYPKSLVGKTRNSVAAWDEKIYEVAYKETKKVLDVPMKFHEKDTNHFIATVKSQKELDDFRKPLEKMWDNKNQGGHAKYWASTEGRRNDMVFKRNAIAKTGKMPVRLAAEVWGP